MTLTINRKKNDELFRELVSLIPPDNKEYDCLLADIAKHLFNPCGYLLSEETAVELFKLCFRHRKYSLIQELLLVSDPSSEPSSNLIDNDVPFVTTHISNLIDISFVANPLSNEFLDDAFSHDIIKRDNTPYSSKSLSDIKGHVKRFIRVMDSYSNLNIFTQSNEYIQSVFFIDYKDNVRKSLKECENWVTGLRAVTRSVKNNELFQAKYFCTTERFKAIDDLLGGIMTQLQVAIKEFDKQDPQFIRDNELELLQPWLDFRSKVSQYIDQVFTTGIAQCNTETLQIATFMSLSVIDNEPRRNEYVLMATNIGSEFDYNRGDYNENWYDDGQIVLNWYKTVRQYGPYKFIVSDRTRLILDELVSRRRQDGKFYLFIDNNDLRPDNINRVNRCEVFKRFFQKGIDLSVNSRILRVSCITHLKESGALNFVKEQHEYAIRMGHSVLMQNECYSRRIPNGSIPSPTVGGSSSISVDQPLPSNDYIPMEDSMDVDDIIHGPTNPVQNSRSRKERRTFPKDGVEQLELAIKASYQSLGELKFIHVRQWAKEQNWQWAIDWNEKDINTKAQNEKIKRIRANHDMGWFGVVTINPAQLRIRNITDVIHVPTEDIEMEAT